MFFIISLNNGEKNLDYMGPLFIHSCSKYGRYRVFVSFRELSFFFIPIFKWAKKYFVKTSCCDKIYILDPYIGKKIERGEDVLIKDENLEEINTCEENRLMICKNCNYRTYENFTYCPRCGNKF